LSSFVDQNRDIEANVPLKVIGVTATTQESHRLRAKFDEDSGYFKLAVDVKEKSIWSGAFEPKIMAPINCSVGFRCYNGSFVCKLFDAEEPSKCGAENKLRTLRSRSTFFHFH
jgi:hypothetical protein